MESRSEAAPLVASASLDMMRTMLFLCRSHHIVVIRLNRFHYYRTLV
jgi:hypothetical protein